FPPLSLHDALPISLSPWQPVLPVALRRPARVLWPRRHRPRRPPGGVRRAVFHRTQRGPGVRIPPLRPWPAAAVLEHDATERGDDGDRPHGPSDERPRRPANGRRPVVAAGRRGLVAHSEGPPSDPWEMTQ